jgi:hypothetical protein
MAHPAAGTAVVRATMTSTVARTTTSTAIGMMTSTVALVVDVVVKMDMMAASTTQTDTSRGASAVLS